MFILSKKKKLIFRFWHLNKINEAAFLPNGQQGKGLTMISSNIPEKGV